MNETEIVQKTQKMGTEKVKEEQQPKHISALRALKNKHLTSI